MKWNHGMFGANFCLQQTRHSWVMAISLYL